VLLTAHALAGIASSSSVVGTHRYDVSQAHAVGLVALPEECLDEDEPVRKSKAFTSRPSLVLPTKTLLMGDANANMQVIPVLVELSLPWASMGDDTDHDDL